MPGEPPAWSAARMERLKAQFPEFNVATPDEVLKVDAFNVARGMPPTAFSQQAMHLGAAAAQQQETP